MPLSVATTCPHPSRPVVVVILCHMFWKQRRIRRYCLNHKGKVGVLEMVTLIDTIMSPTDTTHSVLKRSSCKIVKLN